MIKNDLTQQRGFTMLETVGVVLITAVVIAFAAPKISNAMREYRLNIAMRQIADTIQRVKTQAVSNNRKTSLVIDTAACRLGITIYDVNNNPVSTEYAPLPDGVAFGRPAGAAAPVAGASASSVVSFPAGASVGLYQQDFNSRGFPVVQSGAINVVYLTNGESFRAITVNCVGGIRTFDWDDDRWADTRH